MLDPLLARIDEVLAERMALLGGDNDDEAQRLEGSLIDFVEAAWPTVDGSAYQSNWSIDAICHHLQAVTEGHISRLLINVPPRSGKTLLASVCFPAWTWARRARSFRSGSGVKFLCGSYGHTLAMMNSNLTRRLILSPFYQGLWASRFALSGDQNSKTQFDTNTGGSRIATSVGGALLGVGYSICIVDDPHNTGEIESEAERQTTLAWWSEISTTRMNDPKESAQIVVMQRLHEEDVSGQILSSESDDFVHLCIPMRYDPGRHCVTVPVGASDIPWEDPRTEDGELMWSERWGEAQVDALEAGLGPYLSSGRLQQSPQPKGGGIFKRDWWQLWQDPNNYFPQCEFVLASVDCAFTQKEENDPSAMTVWGVFLDKENKRRVILMDAWRKHLEFSADRRLLERRPNEIDGAWRQRTQHAWGLMEWVEYTCRRFKVHRLLIEAKGPGQSAAQELSHRFGISDFVVDAAPVKGDKVARALAVQANFANGMVYAPDRVWSEMVIMEMEVFPKGRYDDLTDSTTQAIRYLRANGLLRTDQEEHVWAMDGVRHKPRRLKPLYPV
jgi:predicted phage terminase large subunit-like protein